MKMSMPFGKQTITTTVSGGNLGLAELVFPILLLLAGAALVVFGNTMLTILAVTVFALEVGYVAWEFVGDKRADRIERRWRTEVALDALTPTRRLALPPAAATPAAYVVDPEREAVPVDLDALERR